MSQQPFEAIVNRYGPTVLRVCRAVLGPTAAEDAWSETFLAALRAYPKLRPDSNVEAWLVTIAHRKALDQLRAEARRALPLDGRPEPASKDGLPGGWESDLWAALQVDWPQNRLLNIVCHGHSVPAGYFATPVVDTFHAYPHLLHRELKHRFPFAVANGHRCRLFLPP